MSAQSDLSDMILRREWDKAAQGDPKAKKKLAREVKRRIDLRINADGTMHGGQPGRMQFAIGQDGVLCYSSVDDAAERVHPEPSDAQKKAGNYRKGHVTLHGLDISIETAKGQRRRPEWPPLAHHYGYIKRTTSEADGDHVDVFLGPNPESELVYIVDQCKKDGSFDEHKCLLGFTNSEEAKAGYLANYSPGWKCGPMKALTVDQFKQWLREGDTGKPAEPQRLTYADDKWITIGGHEEGDKKHVGGFPVKISKDGTIEKGGGPKLKGKKLGHGDTSTKPPAPQAAKQSESPLPAPPSPATSSPAAQQSPASSPAKRESQAASTPNADAPKSHSYPQATRDNAEQDVSEHQAAFDDVASKLSPKAAAKVKENLKGESAVAIQHWWGVRAYYTKLWRRTLGVELVNDGTSELLSRLAPDSLGTDRARKRQARSTKSPERAAKISAALRARPKPKHVI